MNKGGQQRLRFLKAYWVTLVVIGSYSWLRIVAMVRGDSFHRRALHEQHVRNARRIQRAIVQLQGLFIKVGQLFSIMTNFLPEEFRRELEGLQDAVPPRPYSSIKQRFLEDFGKDPHEVFASFNEEPLAAASISQVHTAELKTGERVAVKIQYPDIDRMVQVDLKTFRRILQIVNFFIPTHGLDVVYEEVSQMLIAELDFAAEAENAEKIRRNFEEQSPDVKIGFPRVVHDYSSSKVLTTTFVEATKISSVDKLKREGHDLGAIARDVVEIYCRQIFEHGFYHADPHPGNVLVDSSGKITLLDFGAVASIGPRMRRGIAEFIHAVITQNTDQIAQALKNMGFIAQYHDDEVFDRVVGYFHEKFQESITIESFNLNDIRVDPERGLEHLLALRNMDIGIGELSQAFKVPREWILLERTLLLLVGLCTLLDPGIKPMEHIRPHIKEFIVGEGGDWSELVVTTGKELMVQYFGLPSELRKYLSRATSGRIEVRVRGLNDGYKMMYALGHQVIYALIGVTAAAISTVFHLHGDVELSDNSMWVAVASGAMLLGSIWRQSRRR